MNREDIIAFAETFLKDAPGNYIASEAALTPDCVGLRMYDAPIFAFGSPEDGVFEEFRSPSVIGSHFILPHEWLPGVKTVIAFFLPYSERIKKANALNRDWPADEWLHGRYEGQIFLQSFALSLQKFISDAGFVSLTPAFDKRFKSGTASDGFTSNWSERHVAFACGLGTFSLSTGLITRKGVCGRFGSILTVLDLPKDVKDYGHFLDYCIMCGACVKRCPVDAITLDGGKSHPPCKDFVEFTLTKHKPRYGCGKCQVKVPCESAIPKRKK